MPRLEDQLKALKQQNIAYNTGNFITQDADCLRVLEAADKLSHRPESVLITAEQLAVVWVYWLQPPKARSFWMRSAT